MLTRIKTEYLLTSAATAFDEQNADRTIVDSLIPVPPTVFFFEEEGALGVAYKNDWSSRDLFSMMLPASLIIAEMSSVNDWECISIAWGALIKIGFPDDNEDVEFDVEALVDDESIPWVHCVTAVTHDLHGRYHDFGATILRLRNEDGEFEWTPGAANNSMVTQQGLIVSTIEYGVIGGQTALYGVHEDIQSAMESIENSMESISTEIQAVRIGNE